MTTEPSSTDPLGNPIAGTSPTAAGALPSSPAPPSAPLWPPAAQPNAIPTDRPTWAPPRESTRRTLPSAAKLVAAIVVLVAVFAAGIGVGRSDSAATVGGDTASVSASLPPEFATYTEKLEDPP